MSISIAHTLTVDDLLRGDIQLASPPAIYFALNNVIDDPHKSIQDAALVIESDAALAVKLLKIVNSAFFGFPAQINSIAKAITLIGSRELRNLALATVIVERFSDLPGQMFSMHDFWSKNLRAALIARELDLVLGKNYAETAFLCGLVHNIGQLVLYRRIPVLAREVDLLLQSQRPGEDDECNIEQDVIGFDHYQVGARLCQLWNLPEEVVESIALHNDADRMAPYTDIASITRLAHHLAKIDNPFDAMAANGFELAPEQLAVILDRCHEEFEVLFKVFYPPQ